MRVFCIVFMVFTAAIFVLNSVQLITGNGSPLTPALMGLNVVTFLVFLFSMPQKASRND